MNYIVIDLEATCWKNNFQMQNEIIEIGALKINESAKVIDEFSSFVKPKLHPILSPFCIQLTSISQKQIDEANPYPTVIKNFIDWIGEEYKLCSWGFYDKNQFTKDCELHNLDVTWIKNHISIKHQYAKIKYLQRPIGMDAALIDENLQLDGVHHRGIDDARNISKIFIKYFNSWEF
jgi:inhibitor of KinA sporulation pathway (predicted exonuclease)